MQPTSTSLQELEARARMGDAEALTAYRQEWTRRMIPVVRRVMRAGQGSLPLHRHILTTARQLARHAAPDRARDGEEVVRRVARCLGDWMVDKLGQPSAARQGLIDTVRI